MEESFCPGDGGPREYNEHSGEVFVLTVGLLGSDGAIVHHAIGGVSARPPYIGAAANAIEGAAEFTRYYAKIVRGLPIVLALTGVARAGLFCRVER